MTHARIASAKKNRTTTARSALVVGGGSSGLMAAKALTSLGVPVTLLEAPSSSALYSPFLDLGPSEQTRHFAPPFPACERFQLDAVPEIRREGHLFSVTLDGAPRLFGCVFLAGSAEPGPLPAGLPAGVRPVVPGRMPEGPGRAAFVLDYGGNSPTVVGMTAVAQAIENHVAGGESYVLMGHAPVSGPGGEELYDRARNAGVRFIRFGEELPEVCEKITNDETVRGFSITIRDVIDPSVPITVECDRVFVAGRPSWSPLPRSLYDVAIGDVDEEGLLLDSSIHCHSGRSFRSGVFAIGEATGETDVIRVWQQASSAAFLAREWMERAAAGPAEPPTVTEDCIRCLTCYRICPHAAISFHSATAKSQVQVSSAGCEHCGLCVSECPRQAIEFVSTPETDLSRFLAAVARVRPSRPLMVFGCQRSAAKMVAQIEGIPDVVFCSVRCAGRVSEALLWEALTSVARGILVVGCHSGNCASQSGTDWAAARVASIQGKLAAMGMQPKTVRFVAAAPVEPARFRRVVTGFVAELMQRPQE